MRVIAGTAGGLQLKVPRSGVRPTMDRVKAAIFSSLGEKVIGARVLDLFAGAGGLGIEAMSRGAASAVFVESNPNAARIVERNLAIAGLDGRVRMRDAFAYLKD
ncbi:MAG: 16S rRNA (guanine(966)-N(2))-methyltransferase RsmD, partial [Verrucomicrobia bacterium]